MTSKLSDLSEKVLDYLLPKYQHHIFTLSEAMLESSFNPEDFGGAVVELVKHNILVLSIGGSTFSAINTKRGMIFLGFDVTDDEMWQKWKRGYYSQGVTDFMRERIKRMHLKIPCDYRYKMDYARIRQKEEWK